MAETEKYARVLERNEGWLCLDFANTVEWHTSDQPVESLNSYGDLVAWAQSKGIVTDGEAERLMYEATLRPEDAQAIYRRAIELREAVYRIFGAVADGEAPASVDLAILNTALVSQTSHFQIVSRQDGFVWDWPHAEGSLDPMLWVVVRSAANLLTHEDLARVGKCADDRGCGWLFLDTSRNRSRRWCSMDNCGNRAKAKQHYKRQHLDDEGVRELATTPDTAVP